MRRMYGCISTVTYVADVYSRRDRRIGNLVAQIAWHALLITKGLVLHGRAAFLHWQASATAGKFAYRGLDY